MRKINFLIFLSLLFIFSIVSVKPDSTPSLLQNEIVHVDNSLEYLRAKGLGVHDMAEYVISKNYLGTQIPNKQQIIDYFDNNQNQTDGSWKDVNTPMFTTHRVLLAYYILNAVPNRNLDSFFSNYDTWEEALAYDKGIHGSFDGRDIYHIVIGYLLYKRTYPIWMNDFFTNVEKDLTWTNSTDLHKRTHILYSYVIARRQFPNLDGIINETLKEQSPDGHWDFQCLSTPRPVYCNSIQLVLLQQIIKLYPNHRTTEIQNSIDKSRQWVYDSYNTTTINGVVMGYFGSPTSIEDAVMVGIMSAGINGLMDINVDMTFQDILPTTTTTTTITTTTTTAVPTTTTITTTTITPATTQPSDGGGGGGKTTTTILNTTTTTTIRTTTTLKTPTSTTTTITLCVSSGNQCKYNSDCCSNYCCKNVCSNAPCAKKADFMRNITIAIALISGASVTVYYLYKKRF